MQFIPNPGIKPKPQTIHWLNTLPLDRIATIHALPEHADTRHYFRVITASTSYVLMETTCDEKAIRFAKSTRMHQEAKLPVPKIFHRTHKDNWWCFLISDFGSSSLLDKLNQSPTPQEKNQLYLQAIDTILQYQQRLSITQHSLQTYTAEKAMQQMQDGCMDFFKLINAPTPHAHAMQTACEEIAHHWHFVIKAPTHVDYHSANLMVTSQAPHSTLGILDYQDAMIGPYHYDLASLIFDHYVNHSQSEYNIWMQAFYHSHHHEASYVDFQASVATVAMQRHIKNLGVFAKLIQKGKQQYLKPIPHMINTMHSLCRYAKHLQPIHAYIHEAYHKDVCHA